MKDSAKKRQKQKEWVGQVIKFSSSGIHFSEPFHDIVLEQYKMERDEEINIYMSETPGGLYNSCFFYLMSPHGNLTSVVKQLCLYVHGYVCTDAVYVYFPKNICEDLTASKNIYMFLRLGIFYSVCHLSFKSFFALQKPMLFWEKGMCIGVVCLIKSHRA